MSSKVCVSSLAGLALMSGGILLAQSGQPRDAWLMQNYHFTGPPAPGSIAPTDPVVAELRQIQGTLLSIMRKADYGEAWETSLAAGEQAAAISQLIGTIQQRQAYRPPAPQDQAQAAASAAAYTIVFKDHTAESAVRYWADGLMFHYINRQGAHVQVRRDLVDRDLTIKVNRMTNTDFTYPNDSGDKDGR